MPNLSTQTGIYFEQLSKSKALTKTISYALRDITAAGEKDLLQCGRWPRGNGEIALLESASGHVFARGAKWCWRRCCPICAPRMAKQLGNIRAKRANAAAEAGVYMAFLRFSAPRAVCSELSQAVATVREMRGRLPAPSRLPAAWQAEFSGFLGCDWNAEIDWERTAKTWHVHIHAVAYSTTPFTPAALELLRSLWPQSYAEPCVTPEAAARYTVKLQSEKEENMGLFDLAAAGMIGELEELLQAMHGVHLRGTSRALSTLLDLGSTKETEGALAAAVEGAEAKAEAKELAAFSIAEWRAQW